MFESQEILALNSHEKVLQITIDEASSATALKKIQSELEKRQIAFPQLLHLQSNSKSTIILLTGPEEIISAIQRDFSNHKSIHLDPQLFSTVSATCTGATSPLLPEKILSQLESADIAIKELIMSTMTATVLLEQKNRDKALKELHKLIN
jgi:aspartate kinase